MIIRHRALIEQTNQWVEGILSLNDKGEYVISEQRTDKYIVVYVIDESSIMPCYEDLNKENIFFLPDLVLSENLTAEEARQLLVLVKRAKKK